MRRNLIISATECAKRAEKAKRQAKAEARYGEDHIDLVLACSREWERRSRWAENHGGTFNLWDYNIAVDEAMGRSEIITVKETIDPGEIPAEMTLGQLMAAGWSRQDSEYFIAARDGKA